MNTVAPSDSSSPIGLIIFGLVVLGLLVYLIASHKIDLAHVKAQLAGLGTQVGLVHQAAMAPVLVAPAPQATAQPAPADLVSTVSAALGAGGGGGGGGGAPASAAPASDPNNPFVAFKAQGLDLWQCEGLKYLNRSVTAADLPLIRAAGYVLPQGILDQIRGNASLITDPTWDPNQASVTIADCGKNFHVGPGVFTRELVIPDSYTGAVVCSIDKINDKADDAITILVDGELKTQPGKNFQLGPFATIRGPGKHTISGAASDNVFVWTLQLLP